MIFQYFWTLSTDVLCSWCASMGFIFHVQNFCVLGITRHNDCRVLGIWCILTPGRPSSTLKFYIWSYVEKRSFSIDKRKCLFCERSVMVKNNYPNYINETGRLQSSNRLAATANKAIGKARRKSKERAKHSSIQSELGQTLKRLFRYRTKNIEGNER